MKLSIVIPCYNEEDTIEAVIRDCFYHHSSAEMIVVNDGSTDNTLAILIKMPRLYKGLKLKILNNIENKGHAYSVIKGLKEAKGDYVLYMDADNQIHTGGFLPAFFYYDLVSAFRIDRKDKLFRKIISFILKVTIFIRHRIWIADANCPYKLYRRSILKIMLRQLPKDCIVPSIDLEILFRLSGNKVFEIPTLHHPYIKERKGSLQSINRKSLSMFIKAFKEVWKI